MKKDMEYLELKKDLKQNQAQWQLWHKRIHKPTQFSGTKYNFSLEKWKKIKPIIKKVEQLPHLKGTNSKQKKK